MGWVVVAVRECVLVGERGDAEQEREETEGSRLW